MEDVTVDKVTAALNNVHQGVSARKIYDLRNQVRSRSCLETKQYAQQHTRRVGYRVIIPLVKLPLLRSTMRSQPRIVTSTAQEAQALSRESKW